jgi:hypothetical protein
VAGLLLLLGRFRVGQGQQRLAGVLVLWALAMMEIMIMVVLRVAHAAAHSAPHLERRPHVRVLLAVAVAVAAQQQRLCRLRGSIRHHRCSGYCPLGRRGRGGVGGVVVIGRGEAPAQRLDAAQGRLVAALLVQLQLRIWILLVASGGRRRSNR